MTWQGVPWAVGNGAKVPAEAGRLAAWVATRGARGVVLPGDCKVTASAVPDGNINVQPGAVVIPNPKTGTKAETYLGKNIGLDAVAVTPTGAGASRSDLVYVVVHDPLYAGEPAPADVATGPYIMTAIAAGVSPSTKTLADAIAQGVVPKETAGYELARIDLPASTGTVTQAMITDLRKLANPREKAYRFVSSPPAKDPTEVTGSAYVTFPEGAQGSVDVPDWATHVQIRGDAVGVYTLSGATRGDFRVQIGGTSGRACYYGIDTAGTRETVLAVDELAVPASMKGTTQTVRLQARRTSGDSGSKLVAGDWIVSTLDVRFVERAT